MAVDDKVVLGLTHADDDAETVLICYLLGVEALRAGKEARTLGPEWVIKDGIVYSGPQLIREVKAIVDKAKAGVK